MFVLANPKNHMIEVYPKPPISYDPTFDTLTVPDDSQDIVETPNGAMPLVDALMQRTGAFRLVDGKLEYDPDWKPEL